MADRNKTDRDFEIEHRLTDLEKEAIELEERIEAQKMELNELKKRLSYYDKYGYMFIGAIGLSAVIGMSVDKAKEKIIQFFRGMGP